MKRFVLRVCLFLLIPTIGLGAGSKQFYAGVKGGVVMPMDPHEEWAWDVFGSLSAPSS